MSSSHLFGGRIFQDSDNIQKPSSLVERLFAPSAGVTVHAPAFNTFVNICNTIFQKIFGRPMYTEAETPLKVDYQKGAKNRVVYVNKKSLMAYLGRNPHPEVKNTDESRAAWVKQCLEGSYQMPLPVQLPPSQEGHELSTKKTTTLPTMPRVPEKTSLEMLCTRWAFRLPNGYSREMTIHFWENSYDLLSTEGRKFIDALVKANWGLGELSSLPADTDECKKLAELINASFKARQEELNRMIRQKK